MTQAVFWDLLGTLGGDSKTLLPDFQFFTEAVSALKLAQQSGYLNFIVTNQSHIAHGRLSLEEYEEEIKRLIMELKQFGVKIETVYMCPHQRSDGCSCKNPSPEMILHAQKEYDLDLSISYVIGDTVYNDILLAHNCNMEGILILTSDPDRNQKEKDRLLKLNSHAKVADHALAAVEQLKSQN